MLSKYQSVFSFALCSTLCTVALAKPHPQHGGHGHGGGYRPAQTDTTTTSVVAGATSVAAAASPSASSGTATTGGTTSGTTSSSGSVSGKGLIYYSGPPLTAYNAADIAFSLDWADAADTDGASLGTFVPMSSGIARKSLCLGNEQQSC